MQRTATKPKASDVTLDVVYPHPPERVWDALTNPHRMAKWLLPNDFQPQMGYRFTFREGRSRVIHGEVIALEEARRLAYTWRKDGEETLSVVTWTLEPVGETSTRVRLTHTSPLTTTGRSIGRTTTFIRRLEQALRGNILILSTDRQKVSTRSFR